MWRSAPWGTTVKRLFGLLIAVTTVTAACSSNSAPAAVSEAPKSPTVSVTASPVTPLDGTYQTSITLRELEASPLNRDETNDQNWGEFTLTFSDGRVAFTQQNDRDSYSTSGAFTVQANTVTLVFDEGGNAGETFQFRWSLSGDTLTFRRDGPGPVPYVLKPWVRTDV
jgi:hypothetical protein